MSRTLLAIQRALLVCLIACAQTQPSKRDVPKQDSTASTATAAPESPPSQPPPVAPPRGLVRPAPLHTVALPSREDPIVNFRLVFQAGSVDDPPGKEGLTALTTALMEQGGTKDLSSSQLLEALFPMAGELSSKTSKELTTFEGRVHKDHLDRFFKIFTDVAVAPRLDKAEFERLREDAINVIRTQLRGEDDETLGKVGLEALLFHGHPYRHFVGGTVAGLRAISIDDVRGHWQRVFTQDRLVIGLGGAVTSNLEQRIKDKLSALPATGAALTALPAPPARRNHALILEKDALSTAVSMGYAYPLRRDDPDFYEIAFALSYLGEHRQFHGVLFTELREKRGLNYGDYAYPEHFAQEGWTTLPQTNVARRQQYMSIWIRPVEPQNAVFATRGALHFLGELVKNEIPADRFEVIQGFMTGYTRLWEQTVQRRLGYAIDGVLYGTPNFLEGYRAAMARMTPSSVHEAVKRHLHPGQLSFVFVAKDAKRLAETLHKQPPTPIQYPTPKSAEVLKVDEQIIVTPIPVDPKLVEIQDAQTFMEK